MSAKMESMRLSVVSEEQRKEKVVSSLAFPVACNACKNFGEWMENASRGLKRIKTGFEFLVGE
jgi:hypothetical protein